MTEKIEFLLNQLQQKEYRKLRKPLDKLECNPWEDYLESLKYVAEVEGVLFYKNDDFGFNFGADCPQLSLHGNFTPNYDKVLKIGFFGIKNEIEDSMERCSDKEKLEYGKKMLQAIDICLKKCEEYRVCAEKNGKEKLADALSRVPYMPPESFYEACLVIKICIYFLRIGFIHHVTIGRFDQYMYQFYIADIKKGISKEELFETLEAFFIALNMDSDLYAGVQQGDNGQSMVLGGFDKDGNSMFNDLSEMCMKASLELNLIDPKINLRVGKNTPDELYILGTRLTKKGLGFPQYCNDDVVVPGLVNLGYDIEDALNYTVAACWEFIIPGCGMDVPNYTVMNFPLEVNNAIKEHLHSCKTFDELMGYVKAKIEARCDDIVKMQKYQLREVPLVSIFVDDCSHNLKDAWNGGAKYNNFGCHGAGIANAADALAAVKENIFDKNTITKNELLMALEQNFDGLDEIRNMLKSSPKMGNNDDYVDDIAGELMSYFSDKLNGTDNCHGGIWRAGTGSAMEYILSAQKCAATADGRKDFEPYSSSFSPSLDVKTDGLLSVIQSFTKFDLKKIINGGPLTIEVHDTIFRNEIGVEKVAQLVKTFIELGGHQLQINSINRDRLLDAQKHPEKYPNLIVRVWGWSGYFNELDVEYQNHVIRRTEYIS